LKLERAQLALLAALAASIPVSIFASQALLALAVVVLGARLAFGRARLEATPLDAPLLALVVWTLLSASFAPNPARAHEEAKKLLLFALFYLALETFTRRDDRERVTGALLAGGIALAAMVVAQHHFLGFDDLNHRPRGFLGHYMSAAGVMMGVIVLAAARLAGGGRERPRAAEAGAIAALLIGVAAVAAVPAPHAVLATRLFVAALAAAAAAIALSRSAAPGPASTALSLVAFPLGAWALLVSQTRSAWLGALCGLAVVTAARSPRLLGALAAIVLALLVAPPAVVGTRLTLGDASARDRYFMWQAGIDMVIDRPVFGQGPGMVQELYPRYRWPMAPNPVTPHLHNNVLQVAAERGLPGLVFFLWWAAAAVVDAAREARRAARAGTAGEGASALGVLAVLVAVLVAGLFEYNLGDSEVLMLVLLLSALPAALRRERAAAVAA